MPPPCERRWPGIVAGYAVLLALAGLAATPAYLYAEPADKPAVVRLAVAVVVGVALIHLLKIVRATIEAQPPSAFEQALAPRASEPRLAQMFVTLRDELRSSRASQGYFEHVLWPRIVALVARQSRAAPEGTPVKPAGRRLLGRGPSLATLRALVARLEERP
jgi:hypothetical protein